jgi:uncharacterized membrane protein
MHRAKKVRRLIDAIDDFNSFNHFVDMIALALFGFISVCIANKLLAKKLVEWAFFDQSWTVILISTFIFLVIFSHQISALNRRRELSEFEKEAALKAYKSPRRRR